MPMMKNAGRTVPAVRMGCHAGSFCCLNFVSEIRQHSFQIFHNFRNLMMEGESLREGDGD